VKQCPRQCQALLHPLAVLADLFICAVRKLKLGEQLVYAPTLERGKLYNSA
jgi:hypothetical protein